MTKPTVRNIKLKLGADLPSKVTMYRSGSAPSIRYITICFKDVQVKLILCRLTRVSDDLVVYYKHRTVYRRHDLVVYYKHRTVYRRHGLVDLDELCFEPWWLELNHLFK